MPLRPPPPEFFAWFPVIRWFLERLNFAVGGLLLEPTSWWRSEGANDAAGGEKESQHLYALAVDFVGTQAAREALVEGSRIVGLVAIERGEGLNPLGPERPLEQGFLVRPAGVHVQAFEAGTLARLGVPFPP